MKRVDLDGWSFAEDARPGMETKPYAFPGRQETVWLISVRQLGPLHCGRLIVREWDDGRITLERGRVWPNRDEEHDDAA